MATTVTTESVTPEPKPVAICEHIKDNGLRCGSPAIRGRHFCYFHSRAHKPVGRFGHRLYRAPVVDSVEALQVAAAHVMQALATSDVPTQQANSMIAALNLAKNLLRMRSYYTDKERASMATEIPPAMEEVLGLVTRVEDPSPAEPERKPVRPELSSEEIKVMTTDVLPANMYHDVSGIVGNGACIPDNTDPKFLAAKRCMAAHWDAVDKLAANGIDVTDPRVQIHVLPRGKAYGDGRIDWEPATSPVQAERSSA